MWMRVFQSVILPVMNPVVNSIVNMDRELIREDFDFGWSSALALQLLPCEVRLQPPMYLRG
jgi:hypothetical protein